MSDSQTVPTSDAHFASPALARVLGADNAADFFATVWERDRRIFRRVSDFRWLFEIENLTSILHDRQPTSEAAISMGQFIDGNYVAHPVTAADGHVDMTEVMRRWAQGYSLIMPALHARWAMARTFAEDLQRETGFRAEINLIYTPPGATAFPAHYDTHDVVVIQIHGAKKWRFFHSRTMLPLRRFDSDDPQLREDVREPVATDWLERGDVLYMPRGLVHAAEADKSASLHLTIGLYGLLWIDVAHAVLDRMAAQDAALRRSLPLTLPSGMAEPAIPDSLIGAAGPDVWRDVITALRTAQTR